jgi:hypothetical protein
MDQKTSTQETVGPPYQPSSSQPETQAAEDVKDTPKPRSRPSLPLDNKLVVPHPPPIPWDDQKTPDLPYDNPFYTRAIDNSLWLPRNPCGLLNLDDTVDLKTSLTVELAAGELGMFPFGIPERKSPGEMSQISSSPMTAQSDSAASPAPLTRELQDVDGTESIDLPPVIAKRVQDGDPDVERIPRPQRPRTSSGYRGKLAGAAAKSTLSLGSGPRPGSKSRHPSFLEPPPSSSSRSTSDPRPRSERGRSHSIMSTLQLPPPIQRAKSSDHEMGVRHEDVLQVDAVPMSASTSRVSLAPPLRPSRSQNLSTSNAILREVYAEEQDAKEYRIREEQTEVTKSQTNKSWWKSWMFKKLH